MDWEYLYALHPDEAAESITDKVLAMARECIGEKILKEHKSNHPWMTDEIVALIAAKKEAAGSIHETQAAEHCSRVIVATREQYIADTKKNR